MIDDSVKREIQARLPLRQFLRTHYGVASRSEHGKDGYKLVKALCPFHSEKTPSFAIYPDSYTCFGCGEKGDIFTFVQKKESKAFFEAVQHLAAIAGIDLAQSKTISKLAPLYNAARIAAKDFALSIMRDGGIAQAFLEERGISAKTADAWQLGYATANYLASLAAQAGQENVLTIGLAGEGKSGVYPTMRGRVIIPIFDARGKAIAFTGRALDKDAEAKYLHTRSNPLWTKNDNLYGQHKINKPLERITVVEGFFDVIQAWQGGLENVVGVMGTSLSAAQIEWLKSRTDNIVLCLDADDAGQAATLKNIQTLSQYDVNVYVKVLTSHKDPDEFIRKFGIQAFANLPTPPAYEYVLNRFSPHGDYGVLDAARAASEYFGACGKSATDPLRVFYLQQAAAHYGFAYDDFVTRFAPVTPLPPRVAKAQERIEANLDLEASVLAACVQSAKDAPLYMWTTAQRQLLERVQIKNMSINFFTLTARVLRYILGAGNGKAYQLKSQDFTKPEYAALIGVIEAAVEGVERRVIVENGKEKVVFEEHDLSAIDYISAHTPADVLAKLLEMPVDYTSALKAVMQLRLDSVNRYLPLAKAAADIERLSQHKTILEAEEAKL